MKDEEKRLLMFLIMIDIRMDWSKKVKFRKQKAMELAEDLLEFAVLGRLFMLHHRDDGRWLRSDIINGGYEGFELTVAYKDLGKRYNYCYKWDEFSDAFKVEAEKYLLAGIDFYFK